MGFMILLYMADLPEQGNRLKIVLNPPLSVKPLLSKTAWGFLP